MKNIDFKNIKIGKKELLVILIVLIIAVVSVLIVRNSDSAQKSNRSSSSFKALGTMVSVTCYGKNGKDAVKAVKKALVAIDDNDIGAAFDEADRILGEKNVSSALVTIDESVLCVGKKPDGSLWRVGVKNLGSKETGASVVIEVSDAAVISLGNTEKSTSVTVIWAGGGRAYDFATRLIQMEADEACDYWRATNADYQIIYITKDKIFATSGLKDSYTSEEDIEWVE